ncbi:MAG: hypothetical protein M3Y12_06545 [Bacteroidota bacterium]|nr:hypothetical protein [Bacteroidota bacterium]
MPFSEAYLRRIVHNEVVGDFPPFTLGSIAKIENYIRKILARLSSISNLRVEAEFAHYGSGFASFVEVRIAKKAGAASNTLGQDQRVAVETNGLTLYISRLVPYWFYGGSTWSETHEDGSYTGGSSIWLQPESQSSINQSVWQLERKLIEAVLQEFRYGLLTVEELIQPAPTAISITTELADKPYKVFDCFFYWQD